MEKILKELEMVSEAVKCHNNHEKCYKRSTINPILDHIVKHEKIEKILQIKSMKKNKILIINKSNKIVKRK